MLKIASCSLEQVVRMRIFVTDFGNRKEIARAHRTYIEEDAFIEEPEN